MIQNAILHIQKLIFYKKYGIFQEKNSILIQYSTIKKRKLNNGQTITFFYKHKGQNLFKMQNVTFVAILKNI